MATARLIDIYCVLLVRSASLSDSWAIAFWTVLNSSYFMHIFQFWYKLYITRISPAHRSSNVENARIMPMTSRQYSLTYLLIYLSRTCRLVFSSRGRCASSLNVVGVFSVDRTSREGTVRRGGKGYMVKGKRQRWLLRFRCVCVCVTSCRPIIRLLLALPINYEWRRSAPAADVLALLYCGLLIQSANLLTSANSSIVSRFLSVCALVTLCLSPSLSAAWSVVWLARELLLLQQ